MTLSPVSKVDLDDLGDFLDLGVVDLDLGVADLDLGVADLDLGVADLDLGVVDLDLGVVDLLVLGGCHRLGLG